MAKRYIADSFEVSGGVGANVLLDDGTTAALPISFDTTSSTRLANTSGTNTGDQNLQQVTDEGNTTTNSIIVTGNTEQIQIRSSAVGGGYGALRIDGATNLPFLWLSSEAGEWGASVKMDNVSENWVYQFPDKAGTFAMTSDITGINSGTNTGNNAINTLYSGLISADVNATNQGNTFNGISQLVQTDGTGKLPAIDGSQLTGLQALITVGTTAPTSPTVGQLWVDTN